MFLPPDFQTMHSTPDSTRMLHVSERLRIPLAEFEFSHARSSGPGGQNVNKVNSKVLLRWSVGQSPSLPPGVRERFLVCYRRRITAAGELLISSQRFRDQGRNFDDCLDKLREMLAAVATPPARRKRTKPSRASIRRRLDNKRLKSKKKQGRRADPDA